MYVSYEIEIVSVPPPRVVLGSWKYFSLLACSFDLLLFWAYNKAHMKVKARASARASWACSMSKKENKTYKMK